MGISDATFYGWRKKYGGVGPSELRRLRQLEEESRKLKQIVADLMFRPNKVVNTTIESQQLPGCAISASHCKAANCRVVLRRSPQGV